MPRHRFWYQPAGKAAWASWGVDATKDSIEPTARGGYVAHEARLLGFFNIGSHHRRQACPLMGSAYPELLSPVLPSASARPSAACLHIPYPSCLDEMQSVSLAQSFGCLHSTADERAVGLSPRSREGCCGPSLPDQAAAFSLLAVRPCRPSSPALQ